MVRLLGLKGRSPQTVDETLVVTAGVDITREPWRADGGLRWAHAIQTGFNAAFPSQAFLQAPQGQGITVVDGFRISNNAGTTILYTYRIGANTVNAALGSPVFNVSRPFSENVAGPQRLPPSLIGLATIPISGSEIGTVMLTNNDSFVILGPWVLPGLANEELVVSSNLVNRITTVSFWGRWFPNTVSGP